MARQNAPRYRGPPRRVDTTPQTRGRQPGPIWPAFFILLFVFTLTASGLYFLGQPALRIKYVYNGTFDHRFYTRCQYLALDGSWHDLQRSPQDLTDGDCPVIRSFPFHPF